VYVRADKPPQYISSFYLADFLLLSWKINCFISSKLSTMITNKMWKSLETICHLVPRGLINFIPSVPVQLQKSRGYSYWTIRYFVFFIPNAAAIPICTLYRLLTISLPLHLFAIHVAALVTSTCATLLSYIFVYTVLGHHDSFFIHFNRVSRFQLNFFGKNFPLYILPSTRHYIWNEGFINISRWISTN